MAMVKPLDGFDRFKILSTTENEVFGTQPIHVLISMHGCSAQWLEKFCLCLVFEEVICPKLVPDNNDMVS
jgi:hypothetical protein